MRAIVPLKLSMPRKTETTSRPPVQVPLSQRTNEELALLAARENLAAFNELVVRFEARLYNFLLRRVSSRTDAEDLTQEAFVRAWERIESYDPTWRFSTWLFTIASRLAVSQHRRSRPTAHLENDEQVRTQPPDGRDAERDVRDGGNLWLLAAAALKPEQHTALWLRYAEDMGIGEIAQVLGKTHVGVRVCLFRARQMLADKARETGVGLPAWTMPLTEAPEMTVLAEEQPTSGVPSGAGGAR